MTSTGYIYPRWMQAKVKLEQAVLNAKSENEIREAISSWFEETIFEIGFTQTTSRRDIERMSKEQLAEYQHYQNKKSAALLAEQIISNDLYRTEIRDDFGHDAKLTTTIAVVGLPRFIQSKSKVLKYVRD